MRAPPAAILVLDALAARGGFLSLLSVALFCFAGRGRLLILGTALFAARGRLLMLGASPARNRFLSLLSVVRVSFAASGRLLILGTALFAARGRLLILGAFPARPRFLTLLIHVILAMGLVNRRLPFVDVAARFRTCFAEAPEAAGCAMRSLSFLCFASSLPSLLRRKRGGKRSWHFASEVSEDASSSSHSYS